MTFRLLKFTASAGGLTIYFICAGIAHGGSVQKKRDCLLALTVRNIPASRWQSIRLAG